MRDAFTHHEAVCLWYGQNPEGLERELLEQGWMLGRERESWEGYPSWYKSKDLTLQSANLSYSDVIIGDMCAYTRDVLTNWFSSKDVYPLFLFPDDKPKEKIQKAIYTTPLMQLMNDATAKFWDGIDPLDRHAPTNENVSDWVKEEMVSRGLRPEKKASRLSTAIATIIRHPDKPK